MLTVAAILVIVAMMALITRGMLSPGTGEVGAQNAKAGSAVVHDAAGSMPVSAGTALVHDDAGNIR